MKITINEPPRSKKNSMQVVKVKGRVLVLPSKAYREYEKSCSKYLDGLVTEPINHPINIKCDYYMPTRRKVDITNLLEATHDVLVKYGVIADDNRNIVCSVDGSRVWYSKDNPRTEIEITDYVGEYDIWEKK